MEKRDMTKELGLFYVAFLTVRLYIQLDQFIFVQVTLPTLYHQTPSSFILVKKVTFEPLEHCDFVDPQGHSWRSIYQNCNNIDYLQLEMVNINPHRDKNIFVPTVCGISKQTLPQLIHQRFGHVSITRLKRMSRKGLMEGLQENLPELEESCHICILTKATKIPRGPTTYVSNSPPGFTLQMDFTFFNVESICGFTSTFVAI